MLKLSNVDKIYNINNNTIKVLNNINISFPKSGMIFITGKSGSGKSTLLYIIGGLLTADNGNLNNKELDAGFVFQNYNLFNDLTVLDNLKIACKIKGISINDNKLNEILKDLNLFEQKEKNVSLLSGGEMQRVAIARVFATNPNIILADEPTGSLDFENSEIVNKKLKELSKNKLVIYVTHDLKTASIYADRIIKLNYGKIIEDRLINQDFKSGESKINIIANKKSRVPFFIFLKFANKFLFKKSLRFFLSISALIIANLCLLLVFSFNKYDERKTIQNYFKQYDIKKYEVFDEKKYEDIFAGEIRKTNHKGSFLNQKLENQFSHDNILKVKTSDSSFFFQSSINVFFGEGETIFKHLKLIDGRNVRDENEIIISDYLAVFGDKKINDEIEIFFNKFIIVGIFQTDYVEVNYQSKKAEGKLTPIDKHNETNQYTAAYILKSNIEIFKKDNILFVENNLLSRDPTLYLSTRYNVTISNNKILNDNIILNNDEILISSDYKKTLNYFDKKDILTGKFNFFNYDKQEFSGALNENLNLSKYFENGVSVKDVIDIAGADIIVSDEIYDKISKEYYDSYFFDRILIYKDDVISLNEIKNLGDNIKFEEPVIMAIYAFKDILISIKPILLGLTTMFFILASFILLSFFIAIFQQNKNDLAILKILGFKKKDVLLTQLFQVIQTIIIATFGLILIYFFVIFLINEFYYSMFPFVKISIYLFDFKNFIIVSFFSLIILLIINLLFSRKIINVDVIDILKND